jgi:hypothetical protein
LPREGVRCVELLRGAPFRRILAWVLAGVDYLTRRKRTGAAPVWPKASPGVAGRTVRHRAQAVVTAHPRCPAGARTSGTTRPVHFVTPSLEIRQVCGRGCPILLRPSEFSTSQVD